MRMETKPTAVEQTLRDLQQTEYQDVPIDLILKILDEHRGNPDEGLVVGKVSRLIDSFLETGDAGA